MEFCDDRFTALVTAFGTIIFFLYVSKNILKQKSSWFSKNEKRAHWKYNYSFSNWKHELKIRILKIYNLFVKQFSIFWLTFVKLTLLR